MTIKVEKPSSGTIAQMRTCPTWSKSERAIWSPPRAVLSAHEMCAHPSASNIGFGLKRIFSHLPEGQHSNCI